MSALDLIFSISMLLLQAALLICFYPLLKLIERMVAVLEEIRDRDKPTPRQGK